MQPMSSAITGALDLVETRRNSTGQQPSETAFGRLPTASAARDRLVASKPKATDANLLRWLESSLNVVAKPKTRMMFPVTGGYYAKTDSFTVTGLNASNRSEARAMVEAAMTEPTVDQCEEWIAGLHSVTARRADDAAGQGLAMTLYAGCLAQFPADIAKEACMHFALRKAEPNWFPTLSEINEWCERAANDRRKLLESL